MSKRHRRPRWELDELYENARRDLQVMEDEYKMAEMAETDDVQEKKEDLREQRKHVVNLRKLKNEHEKTLALREANDIEKTKNVITTIAVIPVTIGMIRASAHLVRKALWFIP